ncbi:MAG: hypothetical protein ACRC8P_03575 [Spiroplasma sp.]
MKKILKFLLLPVFVISPTVTVVACGANAVQIASQDILNSATGRMQDHIFDMTELKLKEIPNDQSSYDSLSILTRDIITNYYSELVTPGLNWDYPAVAVKVTTDKSSSPFLNKYGSDVESRINLTAHLTYKNLAASKDIVIKISNDKKSYQEKIDAIGNYLKKYLEDNNNFVFPFKTLFKDDLMSNDSNSIFAYNQIQAALRNSLFIPTKEKPIPVIDVAGVDMSIQGPDSPSKIYSLKGIDITTKTITGTLENLTLTIGYESGFYYKLSMNKTFNIVQSFTDATNQIATILNQGEQGLQFEKADLVDQELPKENQMLEKYDPKNEFRNKVAQKIFTFINIIYPTTKMKGSDTWDASRIEIENAASSPYIIEDKNYGYFMVNIKFNFKIDDSSAIVVLVGDLKLNLKNL